jgi:hypothetical protein
MADGWRRYVDWAGGADTGEFTIYAPIHVLKSIYDTWLRLDVIEDVGGIITWRGEIRRIEFSQGNVVMARDINHMENRIRAFYGTGGSKTDWGTNANSIVHYGTREGLIQNGPNTSAEAVYERDFRLMLVGWPHDEPSRDVQASKPFVKCYVMGYKHSMNDRFNADVAEGDSLYTAFNTLVTAAYYVSAGSIANNTVTTTAHPGIRRVWDLCEEYISRTDSSHNIYRGWINADREFNYRAWSLTPEYYLRGGQVYSSSDQHINPRFLDCGVYRDQDSVLIGSDRGGLFSDRSDFLVKRIYVDEFDNFGFVPFGQVTDLIQTIRTLEQAQSGGSSDSGHEMKWRWGHMTEEERDWWLNKHG